MAHSFKTYPGKPTFGSNKESINAGDYILNKKAKATYCKSLSCPPTYNKVQTQGELNLLRTSQYLTNANHRLPFNKSNLNINLVTKLDLTNVECVIADVSGNVCPTTIDYLEIPNFYTRYVIDPCGQLFGNTICGVNNYENYLIYNPPYIGNNTPLPSPCDS
jgi:hypothetical protein